MKPAHSPVRHVPDAERRARLAARHALAPGSRVRTPLDAARAVVALHATEPASVYLAVLARTQGVRLADVDAALYDDRTIVKQLAMRRTLFAFPRETLPAAWGSASARVAVAEHGRLTKSLRQGGISDPDAWLADAREQVLALLATGDGASTAEVRASIDALAGTMPHGSGAWGGDLPVAPRVLTLLGATRRHRAGPQRRSLAPPARPLDANRHLAGRGARTAAGCRRVGAPGGRLAGPVRARHRRRSGVVAGCDEGHRAPGSR